MSEKQNEIFESEELILNADVKNSIICRSGQEKISILTSQKQLMWMTICLISK